MPTGELLERGQLLDALTSHLRLARSGIGAMALIGGGAGIGKTALVRNYCGQVQRPVRVLIGA